MGVNKNLIGVKGDECSCGRRVSVRHCPSCGSPRIYARMNRPHRYLNGETKFVEIEFRCQSCGHLFIEEEREFCEAPPCGVKLVAQKMRVIAEAQQAGEYLRPQDQKVADAVQEMLPNPQTGALKSFIELDKDYRKLVYQLRLQYTDEKVELAREKKEPSETMDQFIERMLKELGVEKPIDPEGEGPKALKSK